MKIKYWIGAVLMAAIVLAVVAYGLDSRGIRSGPNLAGTARTNIMEPEMISPTTTPPSPSSSTLPGKTGNTADTKNSASVSRPSWDPSEPSSETSALEVPEPTTKNEAGLPKSLERTPALDKAPKTGTAEGKLTAGFPKGAVPLPDEATIIKSSVENQSGLVVVGVEVRTSAQAKEMLTYYRTYFDQKEWLSTETTPVQGTTQLHGGIGNDSMTVTIRQLPTGETALTAAGVFKVKE